MTSKKGFSISGWPAREQGIPVTDVNQQQMELGNVLPQAGLADLGQQVTGGKKDHQGNIRFPGQDKIGSGWILRAGRIIQYAVHDFSFLVCATGVESIQAENARF